MSPENGFRESPWRQLAAWAWPSHPATWREVPARLRPTLGTVFRLTAAAVAAYVISQVVTPGTPDLTGPLTALLVVQASAFSTIKMSAVRVGAVLSGILVATLLSTWIGLTWWSLAAAIAASLLLAKVLRLGEQALETPISAMLILGVSNHDIASETRILNTLIGAAVGVAFSVVYPPAMPIGQARQALLRVVEAAASALDTAAEALETGPVTRGQVTEWIGRVRSANREVARATETIGHLRDSRRFNPRALGTVDVEPVLASALDTFEHCLLAIRALFTLLLAELPPEGAPEDTYGDELRSAFAVVLHDSADCLRAFGGFVIAESEGREQDTEQALAESLDILRETQAILTELILVRAREDTSSWLLRGSILAAVEQVLARLDLEDRARVHRQWKEEQDRRPLAQLPRLVHDVLPHPDRPYPRGLQPGRVRRRGRPDQR
ncbi:aromatic acid exporter family protein [Terrabacter aerolatus]|uniref:FUSC family protein n=1 Tax=Terrabacter aerolatus TaxID=422442 RepID=A0A512D1R7_9MICO|nr:FUSC family protein [Terrabacter aerolatus]GEO30406.1 FUSC family protein [Terrabacter aerolatus]